jgi:hypothetical protein
MNETVGLDKSHAPVFYAALQPCGDDNAIAEVAREWMRKPADAWGIVAKAAKAKNYIASLRSGPYPQY